MKRETFDSIRRIYSKIDVSEYNPYPIDWSQLFSPIERMVWSDIRNFGLPFWPQFPIGPYFADFADPIKKIVIECDGKQYHTDNKRDRLRDNKMIQQGWKVFRLTGRKCACILPSPAELYEKSHCFNDICEETIKGTEDWYMRTSEGFIAALSYTYYGFSPRQRDEDYNELIKRLTEDVINQNMSRTTSMGGNHG